MNSTRTPQQLKALIEEATVDCYNEEEQLGGFYCALEENLALPFQTVVLGLAVTVRGLEQTDHDILAKCHSGSHSQKISLLHLPLADPLPTGAEWILAYRQWGG